MKADPIHHRCEIVAKPTEFTVPFKLLGIILGAPSDVVDSETRPSAPPGAQIKSTVLVALTVTFTIRNPKNPL